MQVEISFSQNFEFVQHSSQRSHNASETTYCVAYINKWNSVELKLNFESINCVCEHCDVLHWISKRKFLNTSENFRWESCCKKNDVILSSLQNSSQLLRELLIEQNSRERDFRQHIRSFNFALLFTFVNYKVNSRITNRLNSDRESVVFQIQEKLYHLQEFLQSSSNNTFVFAQLFFYNLDEEIAKKNAHHLHLNE